LNYNYLQTFDRLDSIKKQGVAIEIDSPLELPSLIARNYISSNYYALRLAKLAVILNAIARINCNPKPLPTIYLYGPDLLGEKEAVVTSGYFIMFNQDWKTNDEGFNSERLALNTTKSSELLKRYREYDWLKEIIASINLLTKEELIRIAYDFALGRSKATGMRKIVGYEAFSPVAVNTLARNFSRARVNGLLRTGPRPHPNGEITIDEVDNNLDFGNFSENNCFKIGPSNNLLTYHAIYFLNTIGWQADVRSLTLLLACEYLRSVTSLKVQQRILAETYSENKRKILERSIDLETQNRTYFAKFANHFVKKSVDSLLSQGAIKQAKAGLIALGNKINNSEIILEPITYETMYNSTLEQVKEINKATMANRNTHIQINKENRKPHEKPIVYIASTCFDLNDIRAEAAYSLREWGYQPYLNEDKDFPVTPKVNSYQACVEAVKKADCLILIIGHRYGGIVPNLGISITELEYETARALGIPTINFCREAVWSLIQFRKKNPNMNYPSLFPEDKQKIEKIFTFLDNVRKYEPDKMDNWVYPFKNSIEFKELLRKQIRITCPLPDDIRH
jgi:hypothetical protein